MGAFQIKTLPKEYVEIDGVRRSIGQIVMGGLNETLILQQEILSLEAYDIHWAYELSVVAVEKKRSTGFLFVEVGSLDEKGTCLIWGFAFYRKDDWIYFQNVGYEFNYQKKPFSLKDVNGLVSEKDHLSIGCSWKVSITSLLDGLGQKKLYKKSSADHLDFKNILQSETLYVDNSYENGILYDRSGLQNSAWKKYVYQKACWIREGSYDSQMKRLGN